MRMPDFEVYNRVKRDIKRELGNWLLFIEFKGKVEQMEKEEWMTFRGNLNGYAEVVAEYLGKAKELTNLDRIAKLIKEVLEDNQQEVVLLRCLTG